MDVGRYVFNTEAVNPSVLPKQCAAPVSQYSESGGFEESLNLL